jgi:hypothetical protein
LIPAIPVKRQALNGVHPEISLLRRTPSPYVGHVLTDEQINGFAERGFILIPQVVPGDVLARAARRIDQVVAADPPAVDKRGNHFYFLEAKDEPALIAPLTGSPAFSLAEELAGNAPGTRRVLPRSWPAPVLRLSAG